MRNLLLALIFVQAAAAKNGTAMKKFQMKCENIKCPTTENPVYVKLKYDGKKQKDFYIVAINECEINYAKCKPGVKAVIVPMNNCEHNFKTSKKALTRKKRIKRQLSGSDSEGIDSDDVDNQKLAGLNIHNRHNAEEDDEYDDEEHNDNDDNKYKHYIKTENIDDGDVENNDDVYDKNNDSGDSNYVVNVNKNTNGDNKKHNEGYNIDNDDYQEDSDNTTDTVTDTKKRLYLDKQEIEQNEDEQEIEQDGDNQEIEQDEDKQEIEQDGDNQEREQDEDKQVIEQDGDNQEREQDEDKQVIEQDGDNQEIEQDGDKQEIELDEDTIIAPDPDYDKTDENEVNFVEYKDTCPKECPAKKVMVCARCQHNIHRTFLSVCHLRMFACQHLDEKLELVSRKPCMQSSPYLADLPAPKGTLKDPGDEDQVLKFIHCRNKGRLERDPKCQFRKK